ncbi:MAG TPA: DUF4276 family protein [Polyangiaceae bacterium]|nr:DUF4276 family protein [Polyangiaceae bacterium]
MRTYVLVEGHGETDAITNLVTRLARECAPALLPLAPPIRAPGIVRPDSLRRYVELVRTRPDAHALLALRDDEDGCPKTDAPLLGALLRDLALPFPSAAVLAYREYESLFLPCIEHMAGHALDGPGGARPGLRADARYHGDFEAKRGVKEWLTSHMPKGRSYKPTVDQLPLTRMVDFAVVRASGLPWFGSLERALVFLATHLDRPAVAYPPATPIPGSPY